MVLDALTDTGSSLAAVDYCLGGEDGSISGAQVQDKL
jgi:hypothetical protein